MRHRDHVVVAMVMDVAINVERAKGLLSGYSGPSTNGLYGRGSVAFCDKSATMDVGCRMASCFLRKPHDGL